MKKITEKQKAYNEKRSMRAMERLSKLKLIHAQQESGPRDPRKVRDSKRSNHHQEKKLSNSNAIERLANMRHGQFNVRKVVAEITVPSNFSLIENPHESLTAICKLANTARANRKIKCFNIDHSNMKNVDLAAETILGLVVTDIERECKGKKLQFKGYYPSSERLTRLLKGIGIIKSLSVEHEYLSQSQRSKIQVFERRAKRLPTNVGSLSYVELTAKKFVDHINDCLARVNRRLTEDAVDRLSTYTGEIIGNAEEHSGENSWHIAGYYDDHDESHLCEIAIFNFGKTFSETFTELSQDSFAYQAVSKYILKHKTNNYFTSGWNEEDLLTLAALQGDVSSKNANSDDTRGNGTVEMIEFFDRISRELGAEGDASPEMAILSGSSYIRFDGKYSLTDDDSGRKIIAFNSQNDLNFPPDAQYVSNLAPLYFPGTIISIRFILSENETLHLNHE